MGFEYKITFQGAKSLDAQIVPQAIEALGGYRVVLEPGGKLSGAQASLDRTRTWEHDFSLWLREGTAHLAVYDGCLTEELTRGLGEQLARQGFACVFEEA